MLVFVLFVIVVDKWVIGSGFEGKGFFIINKYFGYF